MIRDGSAWACDFYQSGKAIVIERDLLNDLELRFLDLLAKGHTVKSIAILTGKSVGAINERLRDARRKTGVGSSRELARLIKPQESRHEKTSLEVRSAPLQTENRGDALSAPVKRKDLVLMSTFIVAVSATIAAAALSGPTLRPATSDTSPEIARTQLQDLRSLAAAAESRRDGSSIVVDQQTVQVLRSLDHEVERLAPGRR